MSRTFGLLLSLFVYTGCPPIVLNETDDMNSTMADMASHQELDVLAKLDCSPVIQKNVGAPTWSLNISRSATAITLSFLPPPVKGLCGTNNTMATSRDVKAYSAVLACYVPMAELGKFKDISRYDAIIEQTARLPVNTLLNGIAAAGASISLTLTDGTNDVFVFRPNPPQIISTGGVLPSSAGITTSTSMQTPAIALSTLTLSVKFEAYVMCDVDSGIDISADSIKWYVTKLTLKSPPQ